MKIGIVGSEGAKFTPLSEGLARLAISQIVLDAGKELLNKFDPEDVIQDPPITIVSGECHLGGVDIWAKEHAKNIGIGYIGFPPRKLNWSEGYKPRNLQIARESDLIYCITVDILPPNFKGMKFPLCYHCANNGRSGADHVKSGGCWTCFQAMKLGKKAEWIIIPNV